MVGVDMKKLTLAEKKHFDNLSIMAFNKFFEIFENGFNFAEIEQNLFYQWLIDKIKEMKRSPLELKEGTVIYRARIVSEKELGKEKNGIDLENFNGYDDNNSREPPFGMSKNGRCNNSCLSYFYGADNEYTALCEVRPSVFDFISLSRFEAAEDLRFADVCGVCDSDYKYFCVFLKNIFRSLANEKDTIYKISQYISDLFRKYGFDGVRYTSSLAAGRNYVVFNSTKDNLKFLCSEIICLNRVEFTFDRLSSGTEIQCYKKDRISLESNKNYLLYLKRSYKGEK